MAKTVVVRLLDLRSGVCEKEETFLGLTPQKALIAAVMQENGDYEAWKYPDTLNGIRESSITKGVYLCELGENRVLCARPA